MKDKEICTFNHTIKRCKNRDDREELCRGSVFVRELKS